MSRGLCRDKGIVFKSTIIERRVGTNVNVLTNGHFIAVLCSIAADSSVVLDSGVLAHANFSGVTTHNYTVPERGSLSETNISDHSSVRSDPVSL